jgi:CheY-like chemotaxis protein
MQLKSNHKKRAMIVDDELIIATEIESFLLKLGYEVAGTYCKIKEALNFAENTKNLDFALLDININRNSIYPLASLLKKKHIPFIFITGYNSEIIPEEFRSYKKLEKPFSLTELHKLITHISN